MRTVPAIDLRRWAATLGLICAMLIAPLAMASERVHPAPAGEVTSHCAQMASATASKGDPAPHAPAKQFRCMGACFGVAPEVVGLVVGGALPRPVTAIPAVASLEAVIIAHDPPPPRSA